MHSVLFEYLVEKTGRLQLHAGSSVVILQMLDTGWWDGVSRGKRGWFPSNFVSSPYVRRIPPLKVYSRVNAYAGLTDLSGIRMDRCE